ncbi:hypothetical protein D3C73_1603520 [compost metagenome]
MDACPGGGCWRSYEAGQRHDYFCRPFGAGEPGGDPADRSDCVPADYGPDSQGDGVD